MDALNDPHGRISDRAAGSPRATSRQQPGPGLIGAALLLAAGVGGLLALPRLPPLAWTLAAPVVLGALAWRVRWARWPWWLALGAAWAHWTLCALLCAPFPETMARAPLVVEGRIASIPTETGGGRRFLFEVQQAWHEGRPVPFSGRVRLTWYEDPPSLRAGEQWRLPVRLKPRHGLANPGGFDFERWLVEHRILATGHLRRGEPPERLDAGPGPYRLDRARQWLAEHLKTHIDETRTRALIQALVVGERAGLGTDVWEVLTRTGTNHLVAISGLHVGLIAGGVFFLVRWLWSRFPRLVFALAAPRAAAIAAILAALGYAALAGFAISTQRALVMIMVVLVALLRGRTLRPYHALALALIGVLLIDPMAMLSAGFWLSFGAVAVLVFSFAHRLPGRDPWTRWGRAQWVVAIGLLPLLLLLFGRASVISPLVNLIAVPIFSTLLLPLVLISSLLSLLPGLALPMQWTAQLLGWCLDGLTWLAVLPWAAVTLPARPTWVLLAGAAGVFLLLAPRGLPGRWLGILLCLPMLLLQAPRPPPGEAWVTLLDVGLGLAAVIRTSEGTLVYDTGPSFPGGFDTGSAVVAPYLASHGVKRIERLVISHADRDHAGGLVGLAERIPIDELLSGEPARLDRPDALPCRAGMQWEWSGVSFQILHPAAATWRGNNASCVLRVEAAGRALLLTGDIESRVERRLARELGTALTSDILVAGHHGSKTSTHPDLLDAVAPALVLYASGYANQFGFPSAEVRARVAARGITQLDTGLVGAIELRLGAAGEIAGPWTWRARAGRSWTHRPVGYPGDE